VEIKAVGDVICDSGQLGNGRMFFFTEPELFMGKEVLSVDKRSQSGGNNVFELFSKCTEETDGSVGVRISAWFVGFRDGDDFSFLPACRKMS